MNNVLYLLFRRLRIPLIALICIYAASVLGFVLIPGVDDQGRTWHMDFFHAFYFVSFMGTTIGFGEVPYPFTDAQRMWTIVTIYATVFAWLYAIGALLSLLQDPAFQRVAKHSSYLRRLARITEPYYLICGYGDTGGMLVEDLAWRGIHTVVVDTNQEAIDGLDIAGHSIVVPGLCADASDPDVLITAGLTRPNCVGVIALTSNDQVNLTIALSTKLLAADSIVICRAEQQDTRDNMASFGTDHIINPYLSFADHLAMAIHSPSMHLLFEWMTSTHDMPPSEPVAPPKGKWIVCGYGRFGKAIQKYLNFEGMETVIIEAKPEDTGAPPNTVIGRGTEASTLHKAKIENAVGIVAGTDNGSNNLSIIMTASKLKPDLFLVARQAHKRNNAIFSAAKADMIMHPGTIIARSVLALIVNPMLGDFLRLAHAQDDDWANVLISRLSGLVGDHAPDTWVMEIRAHTAPALFQGIREGMALQVSHLLRDPRAQQHQLGCVPLLLKRMDEEILLPDDATSLQIGDTILFGGITRHRTPMQWIANNHNVLEYIYSGEQRPSGSLWRWLAGLNTKQKSEADEKTAAQ